MSFGATQMNLEIIILSEVSLTEKDKYHLYVMGIFLFMKQKQTPGLGKQIYGYQREKRAGGINEEFGINIYTQYIVIYKINKEQGPTIQHKELYSISYNGKES